MVISDTKVTSSQIYIFLFLDYFILNALNRTILVLMVRAKIRYSSYIKTTFSFARIQSCFSVVIPVMSNGWCKLNKQEVKG